MVVTHCLTTLLLLLVSSGCTAVGREYGRPRTYHVGETVPLETHPLTSVHTLIDVKDDRLWCLNNKQIVQMQDISRKTTNPCQVLCNMTLLPKQADQLSYLIDNGYHHNWKLDNLPSANVVVNSSERMLKHYAGGFFMGFVGSQGGFYIYNHFNLFVDLQAFDNGFRIVGFGVEPLSVKHHLTAFNENQFEDCPSKEQLTRNDIQQLQPIQTDTPIYFTYNVIWRQSDLEWRNRWNIYLTEDHWVPPQFHIYSIVNSFSVVVILSILVSYILVRNLKRDVAANRGRSNEDDELKGWKSLHGDVFRPPQTLPHVLCAMVGIGVQLAWTGLVVLLLALSDLVSPAKSGSLTCATWFVYTFMGSPVAGYISGRLSHNFGAAGDCQWITALFFPTAVFVISSIFSWSPSTTKLPFGIVCGIMAVSSLSARFLVQQGWNYQRASANQPYDFPTTTYSVIRPIPKPTYYCRSDMAYCMSTCVSPYLASVVAITLVGIVGFSAAYFELFIILTSLFMGQYYYAFGFALIVYLIGIITCSQVTILMVYHRLNTENHYWWWPAFGCAGSIALWVFGYSCIWIRALEVSPDTWVSTYTLYFGKMFLISLAAFLLFGAMGTLAALVFVCKLFSTVRPHGEASYVELLNATDDDNDDNHIEQPRDDLSWSKAVALQNIALI